MNDDANPYFDIGGEGRTVEDGSCFACGWAPCQCGRYEYTLDRRSKLIQVKSDARQLGADPVWRAEIRLRVARGETLESLDADEMAHLLWSWVNNRAPEAHEEIRNAWALAELERDDL